MFDKSDPEFIKLVSKNKAAIYDLLFKKAADSLKSAREIALLYLGRPYYARRVLEEYNNIKKVNIFTTFEFKFIYEPFEKDSRFKIWYVEDPKDTFKDCDMKFDCIIMNPPYGDRYNPYLHNMIYTHAYTYLKENGSCVSLMPAGKLQTPRLLNKKDLYTTKNITTNLDIIDSNIANKYFSIALAENLGIFLAKNNVATALDWILIAYKSNKIFKSICEKIYTKMDPLNKFTSANPSGNFPYKISLNHGHPGQLDEYDVVTCDEKYVYSNVKNSQSTFVNFNTSNERTNFKKYLESIYIKFLRYIERNSLHIYLQMYPWMGNSINPRTGLIGYKSEWTDEDFYKFFNITPEEQKVIEDTMAKYK